jgi:hypothetical protein
MKKIVLIIIALLAFFVGYRMYSREGLTTAPPVSNPQIPPQFSPQAPIPTSKRYATSMPEPTPQYGPPVPLTNHVPAPPTASVPPTARPKVLGKLVLTDINGNDSNALILSAM